MQFGSLANYAPGTQTVGCNNSYGCPVIAWPGGQVSVDGELSGSGFAPSWWGSLVGRKSDGSRLQYLRNRYYDPETGRFTQEDPIGLAGGLNLYGFAGGDPVNFSDLFGLDSCKGLAGCLKALARAELQGFAAAFDPNSSGPPPGGSFGFLLGKVSLVTSAPVAAAARAAPAEAAFLRGVSAAEAADVAATGVLRAGAVAAGNTGKYLTNSIAAAEAWGAVHRAGGRVLRIIVPADATRTFTALGRIDGIGEAWWAPMESLAGARIEVVREISKATVP